MRKMLALVLMVSVAGVALAHDLSNTVPPKPVDNTIYVEPASPRQGGNTTGEAIPITIPGTYTGTTAGFSNNYDAVCPFTGSTAPDVVYSFTPGFDMFADFDLCNSQYDTKLYIFDQAMNEIACNDDFHYGGDDCFVYSSKLEMVSLTGGMTYYIIIDGYGADFGPYQLDVYEVFPPEPLECPENAQTEDEPHLGPGYVDNHNGGCNTSQTAPPFQVISEPVFCGVSGWYTFDGSDYRDTDWFLVEIPAGGQLIVTGEADYPTYIFELAPQDCPTAVVVQQIIIDYGIPATMTINGTPGSLVWLWVGPTDFAGPVTEFNYVLELNIEGSVSTENHTWTSVKSIFN
jgi:hypothetical protein